MTDYGIKVFIKWMLHHGATSDRVRPYLTLVTLVCDNETLARLRDDMPVGFLDEALVEEFLSLADPRETVEMLTYRIGRDISPQLFSKVFERTLATSSDIGVLSGLMFVAGLFLDRHPHAFQLPRKLTDQLLGSVDVDHRLAGLKALRHSMASSTEIVAQLTRALNRDDWREKWAGLSQLEQLLEENGPQLAEATEQQTLNEVRIVLTQMMGTAPGADARRAAERCLALLRASNNKNGG